MSVTGSASASRSLAAFPFRTFDKLRYADTDRQGHVNNAVFAVCLETGRAEFLYDPAQPLAAPGASVVIASLTLTFLAEVNWPGRVDIGTGVTRVGTRSLSLHQGLFQDWVCVATADTMIVQVHDESRRSHPLSDAARAFLERYSLT